ncbi:ABC transporter permease [Flagellimonas sp. HMM57]|uniref:ABC transporter permease n=1 Tax=unclassified Flagellimonas TaxID=2644544 RepID=UPI0013D152A5|nr:MULTISPECIES: ABC transporter permease [unclassified Flagellimonas]UII77708.1 ABC transporter permease [Flagellimonas sp. HMM57]
MIKNHFKIAWRNLIKNKTFSLLNIIGLSVAFGTAILLSMAGFFDLSYDKFHTNANTIYQVYSVKQSTKGPLPSDSHPAPLVEAIKNEVPGIEKATRYLQEETIVSFKEKEINMDAVWVDADFFNMFTFPSIKGKVKNPLEQLAAAVITEDTANRLFGTVEAVGKTIHLLIDGKDRPFTVSAVVADNLPQSTLEFEIAVRFEKHGDYQRNKDIWGAKYHSVYVQLADSGNPELFEEATRSFIAINLKRQLENAKRDGASPNSDGQFFKLELLPLKDVHFTIYRNGSAEVSRARPYLVLGIALLILFIACVNFINMSIAKSGQRLKEIGMRKTLGAKRKQLFLQFWFESLFLFSISLVFGTILSLLLIDEFKTVFQTNVSFDLILSTTYILGFLVAVLLITLFVGGYPAFLLSKLGTLQSLKGKVDISGKNSVRDVLMILQFGIAILLISGTLVLRSQLEFMREKDLGFNKKYVLSFPLDGKMDSHKAVELLRNELASNPDILEITAADNNLGYGKDGSVSKSMMGFEYKNRVVNTNTLVVDYDYVETLDLEIVAGRNFNKGFAKDSLSVVINESMAKEFGEEDPLIAHVNVTDSISYPVIGVVKDYNFENLDKTIEPMTIFLRPDWGLYYAYVKVSSSNMSKSYDAIEKAWAKIEPNATFLGSFLDENINRTFRKEERMTTMITSGSILAIALSCIGLFAISLLIVNERTKEIGVRKVIGASVVNITILLTKDFLKLVGISFLIASPIAWYFIKSWLQDYPFKIDLDITFFLIAGLLATGIALLTVGGRTVKAATQNPIKSLRTE